jgi:hypothetical protein
MTLSPAGSNRTPIALAIFAALVMIPGLAPARPVLGQESPTKSEVRDFLENSLMEMQLGADEHAPFDQRRIEFLPAASLVPTGGIIVTEDLAASLTLGAPHEPIRWTLREVDGTVILALVVVAEGEAMFIVEGPVSHLRDGRLNFDLRGRAVTGEPLDEQVRIAGSLVALSRIAPRARREQRESLAQSWTLERVGDHSATEEGMPRITYTFAPDGSFEVAAEGAEMIDVHTGEAAVPSGRWFTTGESWGRPPLDPSLENDRGPLLLLFGATHTAAGFMILEHEGTTLTMRNLEPIALPSGLDWVTLRLTR